MGKVSVVVSFDAKELVLGQATAAHPRLVVRAYVDRTSLQDDGLRVLYEVDHGGDAIEQILSAVQQRYAAEIEPVWEDPEHWRGVVTYRRIAPVRHHPVFGPLFVLADYAERGVLHFESGLCLQRFDLDDAPDGLDEILDAMRQRAAAARLDCTVRTDDLDEALMDWSPLDDVRNLPQASQAPADS